MKLTEHLADAYRAATHEGAWYGPTLAELIARTPRALWASIVPFVGSGQR